MSTNLRRRIIDLCGLLVLAGMAAGVLGADQATVTASKPMAPIAPADPTAVLKAIPADATAFVAIRNLSELDRDIIGLARQLGVLLGPNGIFPAPLDWIKQNTGLINGVDDTGSLALVVQNCADIETPAAVVTKVVLLVPCRDAKAVLKRLVAVNPMTQPAGVATPPDDGISVVSLMGQPALAAVKGNFLVVSQTPGAVSACVKAKGPGILEKIAPDRLEAYGRQDIFGWANLHGVSQQIRNELSNTFSGMIVMANPMAAGQAQESVAQINKFIDESQEVSCGLALDSRGLTLSGYFRMKPGTELGNQMADTKAPSEPLMIGLMDEPTVFALGAVTAGSAGLSDQQIAQLRKISESPMLGQEIIGQELKPEQIQALTDGIIEIFNTTQMMGLSVANLPIEAGQGLAGVTVVAKVTDSGQWLGEVQKLFQLVKDLVVETAKKEELTVDELEAVSEAVLWKSKAEQLAGIPVDQIAVNVSKFPGIDEATLAQVTSLIGQEGLLVRLATVDRQHVVVTFGGGPDRCANVAGLVKRGKAPLAASVGIRKIADRLPSGERLVEGYLNIDQVMTLISTIAMQAGQPLMIPMAMNNAAPLAFSVNRIDDTAQEVHLMVPMELVLSIKQAAGPIMQMMMGGGMGGGMNSGMGGGPDQTMDMDMDEPDAAPVPKPENQ